MSVRQLISAMLFWFLACSAQAQEDQHEGGIIGTGIVGTITHLGSIYVNGQHILVDAALNVTNSIAPMAASALLPGHIVAVRVQREDADWRALKVRQILPLVGPIEAIDDSTLTVLGTRVEIGERTPIPNLGEWVAVSGLWKGQVVRASRLDPVPKSQRMARISGTYFGANSEGRDVIGNTSILGLKTEHLKPGDVVHVFGQPVPSGLEAVRLERRLFEDSVTVIQVEGYLSDPQPSGLYTVLGSGLIAYTDRPEMIDSEGKVVLCGENDRFDMLTIRPEGSQAHRRIFTQLQCNR